MDDASSSRRSQTKSVHMRHDIVSPALLLLGGNREFLILDDEVCAHLLNSGVRNVQAKLLLRLGEREPELAPGGETSPRREELLHRLACVVGKDISLASAGGRVAGCVRGPYSSTAS